MPGLGLVTHIFLCTFFAVCFFSNLFFCLCPFILEMFIFFFDELQAVLQCKLSVWVPFFCSWQRLSNDCWPKWNQFRERNMLFFGALNYKTDKSILKRFLRDYWILAISSEPIWMGSPEMDPPPTEQEYQYNLFSPGLQQSLVCLLMEKYTNKSAHFNIQIQSLMKKSWTLAFTGLPSYPFWRGWGEHLLSPALAHCPSVDSQGPPSSVSPCLSGMKCLALEYQQLQDRKIGVNGKLVWMGIWYQSGWVYGNDP